jgi:L-asparaginase
VVLVGAIRPSTAPGADGPANLYGAIQVAASPAARGRGVLAVMNNTIHGARAVQKSNTSRLDAFTSPNSGPLGYVDAANARFVVPAAPRRRPSYALPASNVLPRVDVVFGYGQADDFAVEAAIARGALGIVLAGVGSGNAPAPIIEALRRAAARGIVIVRSTRVGSGFVERNVENDDDRLGFVAALDLSPQKARILARLLIANGITAPAAVQSAFGAVD